MIAINNRKIYFFAKCTLNIDATDLGKKLPDVVAKLGARTFFSSDFSAFHELGGKPFLELLSQISLSADFMTSTKFIEKRQKLLNAQLSYL